VLTNYAFEPSVSENCAADGGSVTFVCRCESDEAGNWRFLPSISTNAFFATSLPLAGGVIENSKDNNEHPDSRKSAARIVDGALGAREDSEAETPDRRGIGCRWPPRRGSSGRIESGHPAAGHCPGEGLGGRWEWGVGGRALAERAQQAPAFFVALARRVGWAPSFRYRVEF